MKMSEVPQYLTRAYIESGCTNPDWIAEQAAAIITATKAERWDVAYIREKIDRMREFIDTEQGRLEAARRDKICQCGHNRSEHGLFEFSKGLGACTKCDCEKYTFKERVE